MRKMLIIEDHKDIASLIKLRLSDSYCDGLEICRRIRQKSDYKPALMLTTKSAELDRVLGLEVSADNLSP